MGDTQTLYQLVLTPSTDGDVKMVLWSVYDFDHEEHLAHGDVVGARGTTWLDLHGLALAAAMRHYRGCLR